MELMKILVFDLLGSAPILVGLMALLGLTLQKKSPEKIITGTLKAIVGFLIFAGGAGIAVTALDNFQKLFSEGFGLKGVLPLAEAVTALAQTKFATVVSLIMVLGFLCNLLVARFTKFKYIFLTGQHNLYLAALLTVVLKALNFSNAMTVILGGIILGIAAALYPALAQPYMRKVTGNDDIAMGHYVTIAYAFSGWLGGKVGNPDESTEKLKLPGWLSIFKDYIVSVSISIILFFYVAAFGLSCSVPICTYCHCSRIFVSIYRRIAVYGYISNVGDDSYYSCGNSVFLYRSNSRSIRKCDRRMERSCSWRICYRDTHCSRACIIISDYGNNRSERNNFS